MFTSKQKILVGVAVLVAVLLVAGSYFGSRWLFGPDVESVTEYVLSDEPLPAHMNRPVCASVSQQTSSVPESEDELFSDLETESDSTKIDEELKPQLAALSDEELTALAEALEQDEGKSSKYPPVPDGFPLTPVWLKDVSHEKLYADYVIIDQVLIALWNQGDHNLLNGVLDKNTGKVYPMYDGVVYIEWDSYFCEDSNGQPLEVPYISHKLGISTTVDPLLNADGDLFTEEEIMSGVYATMHPDVEFVNYSDAGYHPATILNGY